MSEWNLGNIKCPHCGQLNIAAGIKIPRDFNGKITTIKCFQGGDVQKGYMKEFNVILKTQIYIAKTEAQLKEEQKAKQVIDPNKMADRMAGA